MTRPLLLDLFCGAGGAAMGYHRAGFDVVGVDNQPQPNYPFEFWQKDALDVLANVCMHDNAYGLRWAAIHASPPCHEHSKLNAKNKIEYGTGHLLGETLDLLVDQPLPYIVENVDSPTVRAEMTRSAGTYTVLCGSMFGLQVERDGHIIQIRRHRLFVTSFPTLMPGCGHRGLCLDVTGHSMTGREYKRRKALGLPCELLADRREAMGIDWMTRDELAESIPPAFTEYLGAELLTACEVAA